MLPAAEAHVWTADTGDGPRDMEILSDDERAHAATFRFEEDRRRWATSRVLLRVVLARYLAVDPQRLELSTVARGRRVVAWPDEAGWLSFSQARSGQLCVVAVAERSNLGVDVELVSARHDVVAIARRALGDDMAARLESLPEGPRLSEFYRAWVREEARGKCRGTGLVEPDDAARKVPLLVHDLGLRDGYAAALAADTQFECLRGFAAEV